MIVWMGWFEVGLLCLHLAYIVLLVLAVAAILGRLDQLEARLSLLLRHDGVGGGKDE